MKKLISLLVLAALAMTGCGSDDTASPPIVPETPKPDYSNLDVQPENIDMVFDGSVKVYLGPFKPCGFSDGYTQGINKGIEHPYCTPNPTLEGEVQSQLTVDDSQYVIEITAREMNKVLGESIRPDLYQPGQYSMLDVLIYLGKTRSDIKVELGEFNQKIGTYEYTVSWDRNGDGQFTEADNVAASGDDTDYIGMGAEQNFQSPHWYGRFTYYAGDFLRELGNSTLETIYERLDEFMIKNNTYLRFESFSPEMTERRVLAQARQVERKANGGGPIMLIDFGEGEGPQELTPEITAKPYNMRTDIYRENVLTAMDLLMTAHEQGLAEVRFSYWPTVSTNANVGNYAVHKVNHLRTVGMSGWSALSVGERQMLNDFFQPTAPYMSNSENIRFKDSDVTTYKANIEHIVKLSQQNHPMTPCSWLTPAEGKHTLTTAALCLDEWGNAFGGTKLHQMTDTWLITYPPEVIYMKHIGDMQINYWNVSEKNNVNADYDYQNDLKYEIYDLSGELTSPLNTEHFGWGVADCGLCHSIDSIHKGVKGGDSPALPKQVEPYYCASCHGNNGAPMGHGESARCFWCHSNEYGIKHHGDASLSRTISEIECVERPKYESYNGEQLSGPCARKSNLTQRDDVADKDPVVVMPPHDQAGNDLDYPLDQLTQGNSDWHTSESFPDPYSCLTCHPNKPEI